MKKFNLKAGVLFGVTMAVLSIFQNIWMNDSTSNIAQALIISIVSSIFSGLLFGWFVGLFTASKFVEITTNFEKQPGEEVFFETLANYFMGLEAVGGKLYLTNNRLVFKSHKLNIQNHELTIRLSDITVVARTNTVGVIDNGLTVTSKDNKIDKFVVEKVDEWVEKLSIL